MSYQVIARKYRPQRFADVVGQEHVTQTLANAIRQNRIAHAYLFCGPRGTGKTTIARIFAKCLNATDGPKVDFDEADPRCLEIAEGRSIDVLEIDGASNNGVEQVRELRDTVRYAPASSRFKVYIIDEVHMLTTAAFNALLKTLEEPPAHVKFMFATTDPEKVLPTILSRCQRFDLRRIPVSLIAAHLAEIARRENVEIDPEALHAIARGADGGLRDAESALDQLISFCGGRIGENDVLSMFGLAARSQVSALADAILQGNAESALRALDDLARHGKDLGRLLSDLLSHFRNLLVFQLSKGDLKLLEVSETEAAKLKEQSTEVPTEIVTRLMEVLTDAEGRFRDAASKKIFVEVALLKTIQARQAVSIDQVLRQLQQLRRADHEPNPAPATPLPPRPSPAPSVASAPVSNAQASGNAGASAKIEARAVADPVPATPPPARPGNASAGSANSDADLAALWRALLESVSRASPFTRSYLIEAHPVSFAQHVLTVGFDPAFAERIELVNNQKTHGILQTKLSELGHPQSQIRFVAADRPIGWVNEPSAAETAAVNAPPGQPAGNTGSRTVPPAAAKPSDATFKDDPLIQKALEVFKGRIVEVRA